MAKRVFEEEKRIEEIEGTEEVVVIRQCDMGEDNPDPYGRLLDLESSLHKTVRLGRIRNEALVNELIQEKTPELFHLNVNNDTVLHIAARAGHIDVIHILLEAYADFENSRIRYLWKISKLNTRSTNDIKVIYTTRTEDYDLYDMRDIVLLQNKQGNTVLHEAMMCKKNNIGNLIFSAFGKKYNKDYDGDVIMGHCYKSAFDLTNNARKSVLYLAVDSGYKKAVTQILDYPNCRWESVNGLSPLVLAIKKQDTEMMDVILDKRPEWIHLMDKRDRVPLHYAASVGYYYGVNVILNKHQCCIFRRDKDGYLPIHLASHGGHLQILKKFISIVLSLDNGPELDSKEMLDDSQRNILHIAANSGKHEVVRYILQTSDLCNMLNQQDIKGNTALHLAASSCHPQVVHYLIWDPRVQLNLLNQKNQTPLDIVTELYQRQGNSPMIEANALYQVQEGNSSIRQQLTWTALKSSGAKTSGYGRLIQYAERPKQKELNDNNLSNNNQYGNRVDTLTVVSTLIVTASVGACLAVPGEAQGQAYNLHHAMFHMFITCITISLFSSIIATITLFWARLGLTNLVIFSLKIVMPLLGIALVSLSLAFMGGIYTVISKLTWLANFFLVMTVIFVIALVCLYMLLFFPSTSTNIIMRYISYYPFIFIASLVEPKTCPDINYF